MENLANILSDNEEDEKVTWENKAQRIDKVESIVLCAVFGLVAIYGLFVLFQVVIKRKFCDYFAIAIPLEITCFATLIVIFDIDSGFTGISDFSDK